MTDEQLIPFREELSKVPKFQWVKTDKAGRVVHFKDVIYHNNMMLVEFDDGTRVNYDLLGDAVMKIADDAMLLDIQPETIPLVQQNIPISTAPQVSIGKRVGTPIQELLKKQKPNLIPIKISLELNLPSVSLYKVLAQSFDKADEEIVEYIVDDLDVPLIKEAVKKSIAKFYSEDNGQ